MSEQPKRKEAWSIYTGEGECLGDFATEDTALDVVNEQRGDFVVHRVQLREGESIIGPEERAVIEAARCAEDSHRLYQHAIMLGVPNPRDMTTIAMAYQSAVDDMNAAVRALREARR